jgi:hypothetical protein
MTREEHIAKLEKEIARCKAYGDYIGMCDRENLLNDIKKIGGEEYESYLRMKRKYAVASAKPLSPEKYQPSDYLGKRRFGLNGTWRK